MATCSFDATALETLLIQALSASDRLEYEQVGAHVATALDALRRQSRRSASLCAAARYPQPLARRD